MTREVVKHHNDLNTVPMRNWTKEEMNFFFSIIAKIKEKGTREIIFDKYSLAELAQYSINENKRFEDTIEGLVKNVAKIHYIEKTKNSIELMNLFSRFKATWSNDLSEMELSVKVTEEFDYVVNRLNTDFTSYELKEFTQIRSTYAKTIYRLLKQWRTVGRKEYSIEEFKVLLDMPAYYTPSEINKNVLTPARKELPAYFKNLKIKPIKSNKRGTPVIAYEFTWQAEVTGEWIENKYTKGGKVAPMPEYSTEEKLTADEENALRQTIADMLDEDGNEFYQKKIKG